jgi:hypothetical protein
MGCGNTREYLMTAADAYSQVIKKTVDMVHDKAIQRLAEKHGLRVLNVTWEDTGRFDFSSVGPNIRAARTSS